MVDEAATNHCIFLNIGVVAGGAKCMSIMRTLNSITPTRFRLNLVALAALTQSDICNKYAKQMGIKVFDNHLELLKIKELDLILELTGDQNILAELVARKSSIIAVLNRKSSTFFFELALTYLGVDCKETEISHATSFASALLEASPDAVMVMDQNYRIIKCNNTHILCEDKGDTAIVGKYCYDVILGTGGSNKPCNLACPALKTIETGKPSRKVHEVYGPKGEIKLLQATTYPIYNQLKEISQLLVTIRDITSDVSERIEARTNAIKSDLTRLVQEDRLSSLGRLVASVCHEINNPIASIVTFNKFILSHIKGDTMPEGGIAVFERYLELSVREALRCGKIVNNLLTFAREKSMETKEIDLIELINTIIVLTSHQMQHANIEYHVNLPEYPLTVWGDDAQVQQCLMNLIFNAIEAMPKGGRLTIEGGKEDDQKFVWITVADNGSGIAPKDLPLIFEPFYTTKSDGKGVGLGLSMLYGIISEHNGTVEVNSTPGKGTIFKIKLPQTSFSKESTSK
jgi:signal transduction histidine kinase